MIGIVRMKNILKMQKLKLVEEMSNVLLKTGRMVEKSSFSRENMVRKKPE